MAFWNRFLGRTVSEASGFAIGGATQRALEPLLQGVTNEAWSAQVLSGISVPPAANLMAQGVAEGRLDRDVGATFARYQGIGGEEFDALIRVYKAGPGVATAMQLRRRNLISDVVFRDALEDEGIEEKWWPDIEGLLEVLLTPAELANAVVQGHLSMDDATRDAGLQGVSPERFAVMVENTGLPPGPEALLDMLRRGVIDEAEFDQGIREGHTKVKYIAKYLATRNRLLSAAEWAGLRLRGWVTEAEAQAGGALLGYSPQEMELLYLNRGRPATTRQVHIGWARGGRLPGVATEREAFSQAVKQSNIRPEYEELLWAQRYTYPSAFVLRALVSDGTFTAAQGEQILIESGWNPDYAKLAAEKWAGSGGEGGSFTGKAQTQLWSQTHRSFLAGESDNATATDALVAAGVPAGETAGVLTLWEHERALIRKQLTPTQIKKAYTKVETNPATGAPWTRDEAIAELLQRGYNFNDASSLLDL